MTSPTCKSRRIARRGAAAVEVAVVSPVLVLMVLGIIEFGRMSMVQQTITNAAREGAREAIIDGSTLAEVKSSVESYLSPAGVSGAEVTLSPDLSGTVKHGDPVAVSVSVPFSKVSWLPIPHFVGGKVLSSTAAMRRESPR